MYRNWIGEIKSKIVIANARRHNQSPPSSYYHGLNCFLDHVLEKNKGFKINNKTSIEFPPDGDMERITFKEKVRGIFPLGGDAKESVFEVVEFDLFERFLVWSYLEENRYLIFIIRCHTIT